MIHPRVRLSKAALIIGIAASALFLAVSSPTLAQTGWTAERTLEFKRVSEVVPSPDGAWLAFEVTQPRMDGEESEWQSSVWVARTDGSEEFRVTSDRYSASAPSWSPDGSRIAFLSNRGESTEVWVLPFRAGEASQVTDTPEDVTEFLWSPDGSQVAFLMRDPESEEQHERRRERRDARVVGADPRMVGLYVTVLSIDDADQTGGLREEKRLSPVDVSVQSWASPHFDWSPDGSRIAFVHQPSPSVNDWRSSNISVVEVSSGKVQPMIHSSRANESPRFSPDGRWIAYTATDDPASWAFTADVHVIPTEGGESRPLARTHDRQARVLGWRADGTSVLVSEAYRTVRRVYELPVTGEDPVPFSPADQMVTRPRINHAGTHLGFTGEDPDRPPEAWVTPLGSFRPTQASTVQGAPAIPTGLTEELRWIAPDGQEVEGLLTFPVNHDPDRPAPLLVIVHGGPTGVFTRSFTGTAYQYPTAVFASEGYAVLRPNPRGSSGYGHAFRYANYEDWGGGDYADIISGVDAVIEMGAADPSRLGVMGWSYGGYMTSWIVTQTDRFKAASIGAALPNLVSFSGTTDVPGFIPDYFGGEFWEVPGRWQAHSPIYQVGGVTTPSLIQHGEEDVRVPVGQAHEFHNALARQGVETKLVVYPRQPHGIQEPKLLLHAMETNLDWFDRWVVGRDPVVP